MRHEPLPAAEPAPITPEMLMDLLRVEAPAGSLLIQGIARDLQPWSRGDRSYVYGRLTLGSASVRFRTESAFAPQEGEAVTIQGTLRIEPANRSGEDWCATHQVMLAGKVVGTWEPRAAVEPVLQLPSRDERLPLDEFVSLNGVASLAVLVSGTARADIARTLSKAERPEFMEANCCRRVARSETRLQFRLPDPVDSSLPFRTCPKELSGAERRLSVQILRPGGPSSKQGCP